ncbi:hypothetical protein GF371_02390 [Candidatus Woesearchaeota archaeon]|nr:hypothetical protein [Candidatus Woesearchaeota archaeon]
MPKGEVIDIRFHQAQNKQGIARMKVKVKGKTTPVYLEVPMKLDFKVGDMVEFKQLPGTSAFRDVSRVSKGYKAKKK